MLIVVLVVFAGFLALTAIGGYFIYRSVSNFGTSVLGGASLECPTADEISGLVGSQVTSSMSGTLFVASGCYYDPAGPGDVIEVIIVSGSKIIADEEITSFANEGSAAQAQVRSIDVGDRGLAWASDKKSAAIAVGESALISVEVQGKDFTPIPDKSDAAIAILQKVLH